MTPPDAASRASTDAGIEATALGIFLHASAVMPLPRDDRSGYYRRLFSVWPRLKRYMSELERLTPTAAQLGYEDAAKARDFVEARSVCP